jgi:ABC-type multidrug transport system fused ATPase/permease subunit
LQDNRAVSYLMDTARGSSAPFDPDRDQELLDGMLDAAIKVVRDETDAKLSEKDKKIRELRAENRKAQKETQAEYEARLNEEARKIADVEARLAELERQRVEDARRLALIASRHEAIMNEGIAHANKWIGRYQVLGAVVLAVAGILAAFGVFWDPSTLPVAVDWGSKLIAAVGVIFTVLALLGRPVPGLWQVIERRGEKWYADYCVNKGVPAVEAQERLLVGTNRLLLAEVDRETHETDGKAVHGQDS